MTLHPPRDPVPAPCPAPEDVRLRARRRAASALACTVIFLVHFFFGVVHSYDSKWSLHLSMSLVREGNLDLDEYEEIIARNNYYAVRRVNGRLRSIFPIGTPVLTAPLVYLADRFYARTLGIGLDVLLRRLQPRGLQTCIASLVVALTALVLLRMGLLLGFGLERALLAVFIFAFCTSAWSTASRALWQHGPSMLFLSLSIHLFLLGEKGRPRAVPPAGFTLACAFVIRPTNAIPLALFTLYAAWKHRRRIVFYLALAALVLVPFALYNLHVYGRPLPPYYAAGRIFTNPRFFEALAGNLVSPGRGLFLYSPVLLFAFAGIFAKVRRGTFRLLDGTFLAVFLLHWLALAGFRHWWGGHSVGPRLFCDMVPVLIYFLFFALERSPERPLVRTRLYTAAFAACLAASFFIHFRCATRPEVVQWNTLPANVDTHPERLWDWRDIPFLRGLR